MDCQNTNPVLKKVLNNNSRAFAFNNGGIIKLGEFINYMNSHKKISEILLLHSGIVVVLSNK